MATKLCSRCGVDKGRSDFYRRARSRDGLQPYCKQCDKATGTEFREAKPTYNADYRATHVDQIAASREERRDYRWAVALKSQFNLTPEQYWTMFDEQDGKCAACGEPERTIYRNPTTGESRVRVRLCVDHDHSCCSGKRSCGKCVRQLLCHPCNVAAGLLGDSSERVERLAKYLRNHGN